MAQTLSTSQRLRDSSRAGGAEPGGGGALATETARTEI